VRRRFPLRSMILLTGYSRGGQFAHRFALAHPSQVEAVGPFASGTWTTPGGRFLVEGLDEVRNAWEFFSNEGNASAVPGRLRDLFAFLFADQCPRVSRSRVRGLLSWLGRTGRSASRRSRSRSTTDRRASSRRGR